MHEVSEVETRGEWCRFWVDMGTADEMALDVLINAMSHFSQEYSGIRTLGEGACCGCPAPREVSDASFYLAKATNCALFFCSQPSAA